METDTVDQTKDTSSNFAEVSICISRRARDILRTLKNRLKRNTYSDTIEVLFNVYQDWSQHIIPIVEEKTEEEIIKEELEADQELEKANKESNEVIDPTL